MIRLLVAAAFAMAVSLVGTRFLIRFLRSREIGQPIREEGPQGHITKAGTPTMGGVAIVGSAAFGWLSGRHRRRPGCSPGAGAIIMFTICLAALVGLIDDGLKVSKRAQPRAEQAGQDHRAARRRHRLRRAGASTSPMSTARCRSPGTTTRASSWARSAGACWPIFSSSPRPTR